MGDLINGLHHQLVHLEILAHSLLRKVKRHTQQDDKWGQTVSPNNTSCQARVYV